MENRLVSRRMKYEQHDLSRNDRVLEMITEPSKALNFHSMRSGKAPSEESLKAIDEERPAAYENGKAFAIGVMLPVIHGDAIGPINLKKKRKVVLKEKKDGTKAINNFKVNSIRNGKEGKGISTSGNLIGVPDSKFLLKQSNDYPSSSYASYINRNNNHIKVLKTTELTSSLPMKSSLKESHSRLQVNSRIRGKESEMKTEDRASLKYLTPLPHKLKPIEHKYNSQCTSPHHHKDPIIHLINSPVQPTKEAPRFHTLVYDSDEDITIRSYHCLSQPGLNSKGLTKINQDFYFDCVSLFGNKTINLFGVLDGHGVNGHLISQFVANYLKTYFNMDETLQEVGADTQAVYRLLFANDYEKVKTSFTSAEEALIARSNDIDSNYSGTTCLLVLQIGNRLICANAGDSRAIMIKDRKTIISLSADHKPEIAEERSRILLNGGEIAKEEEDGPYRVWAQGQNYPGIAMSRSIGDLIASSLGVIPLPDVKEFQLDDSCKYIILASDGIWDFLSNERVEQYARKMYRYNDPQGLCDTLISKATEKWRKEAEAIDDITVISIMF